MLSNILKNKLNKKDTSTEIKEVIKNDSRLANKIINVMRNLRILDICSSSMQIEIFNHKIEEIADSTFNFEDFKVKTRNIIQ